MHWTKSCSNYRCQTRRLSQIGAFTYQDISKFWLLPFPATSLPTVWPSWNETTSMVGYPNDLKQWWPTSRPAHTKQLILITFGLQGKWKRKTPWSYPEAHKTKQLITPLNQEPLFSSPCGSSKGTNQYLKWPPCAWHTSKRKAPKRDEEVESEDPDSIDGVMEEFTVHLARAVKDAKWRRSAVIIAVAWSTLSMTAHWWETWEKIHS